MSGNSFFFNNGVHRFVRKLLAGIRIRRFPAMNLIAIGGASLFTGTISKLFPSRTPTIASYPAIKNDSFLTASSGVRL